MPQRRWRKFRATRSALSRARAGPATCSRGLPSATRWPSSAARVTCTAEESSRKAASARARPATTSGSRARTTALAWAVSGTAASVVTSPLPMSSARASATARRISSADNGSTPAGCTKSRESKSLLFRAHRAQIRPLTRRKLLRNIDSCARESFGQGPGLALAIWAALNLPLFAQTAAEKKQPPEARWGKDIRAFETADQTNPPPQGCDPVHWQLQHPALDEPCAGFPRAPSPQPRLRRVATRGLRRVRETASSPPTSRSWSCSTRATMTSPRASLRSGFWATSRRSSARSTLRCRIRALPTSPSNRARPARNSSTASRPPTASSASYCRRQRPVAVR